ncbi:hypothetical protein EV421DRAFT_1911215 [Armillaria borealis]|uniref:Protein kinase domain-containing protein n=1 Tax=Armillaria borealis TaxID=47425 RepID=A0AA39MFQ3_9AGAR|nr:hypothetical protein EV421DRAFT_1911215 [Armillaria borealis]
MLFASLASFSLLRLAINDLEQYYQELELPDSPSIQSTRYFSDTTDYDAGTEVIKFQYLQPLEVARETRRAHGEEQVVIKFVRRYGAGAHRLLASEGKALVLYHALRKDAKEREITEV